MLDCAIGLIAEPMVWAPPWWIETITYVAVLPSQEWASGFSYLVARMQTIFELRMDSARHGKSSLGSAGRKARGTVWIASWVSLGARRKGSQGKGQPGVVPHREELVELGGESVEIGGKGRCRSGRV